MAPFNQKYNLTFNLNIMNIINTILRLLSIAEYLFAFYELNKDIESAIFLMAMAICSSSWSNWESDDR